MLAYAVNATVLEAANTMITNAVKTTVIRIAATKSSDGIHSYGAKSGVDSDGEGGDNDGGERGDKKEG